MRLQFAGFEEAISIDNGTITVVEVHNKTLFSRVCQSLLSGRAEKATEPHLLWDDAEKEVNSLTAFKIIANPLSLPWLDKDVGGKIYDQFEELFFEDDSARMEIEELYRNMQARILTLGLQLQSNYSFALEWETKKFLRAFSLIVEIDIEEPLLDNIIRFLELLADVGFKKTLLFINLKNFFSENDLRILYEQIIFYGNRAVLLESALDKAVFEYEKKYIIDQDFVLKQWKNPVRSTSLCSGVFVPMVLEQ